MTLLASETLSSSVLLDSIYLETHSENKTQFNIKHIYLICLSVNGAILERYLVEISKIWIFC